MLAAVLGLALAGGAWAKGAEQGYTGRHVVNGHVYYGHLIDWRRGARAAPAVDAPKPAFLLPVQPPVVIPVLAPIPRPRQAARASRAPARAVVETATAAVQPVAIRAGDASVQTVTADDSGYAGQLALPIGGSKILRFREAVGRVLVGDPKVADVVPLSDHTLYVLAKAAGATSLTVLPQGDAPHPLAAMDLRVGFDVDSLKRAFHDTMPDDAVNVHAEGDALVLTGAVTSSAVAARAAALADHYAPGKVVNLMSVRGPEQVMLKVHVAEVQRSALRQFGITNTYGGITNKKLTQLPAQIADSTAFANIYGGAAFGATNVNALLTALEAKGYATTLAEPTLIALSGETAVFFAGGEYPVPVPQIGGTGGNAQITVQFKQYGVSVGFTPTVYGDTINLAVAPEVSSLDKANTVNLQGFSIPGILTRRAKTTVELRDGQSFAIAGLIRREFSDSLRGLPGVSSLPIFGQLFRSTAYQNNETEVVIIVTVHLAKPTTRENLILPTETSGAPATTDLFLMPDTDAPKPLASRTSAVREAR